MPQTQNSGQAPKAACDLVALQSVMADSLVPEFKKTHRPFFLGYVSGLCHGLSAQMGIDPATEEANLATLRAVAALEPSRDGEKIFDELMELHSRQDSDYSRGQDVGFADADSFMERQSALGLVRGLRE